MPRGYDLGINNRSCAHNKKCLATCPALKPSAQLTSRPKAAADYCFLRAHKRVAACLARCYRRKQPTTPSWCSRRHSDVPCAEALSAAQQPTQRGCGLLLPARSQASGGVSRAVLLASTNNHSVSSSGARLFFTRAHNKGARLRPALDWIMHCNHRKDEGVRLRPALD